MRTNDVFAYNKLTISKLHLFTKYGHILPYDFKNDFRGHSRDTKNENND